MKKIAHRYNQFEDILTNFLYVGIVFFVFLAAIMRWVGSPLSWSVEFAQFLFVWAIFLGANRTLRERKHISVDIFMRFLSKKARVIVDIFTKICVLGFLGFLIVYGFELSVENSARQINNLPLSYSWITAAVPVGSFLMFITTVIHLLQDFKRFKQTEEQKA